MKPLVLIVEDEAPLVALLRYNLEKEGFAVAEAADGEEALLQIAERRPDAVLLDWMLPLVSGIEVCRQIRRAPATRSMPVIMLTARGEESDRIRGLDTGADDYVVKPFSMTELTARIAHRGIGLFQTVLAVALVGALLGALLTLFAALSFFTALARTHAALGELLLQFLQPVAQALLVLLQVVHALVALLAPVAITPRILALLEGLVAQLLLLADHVAEFVQRLLHVVATLAGLRHLQVFKHLLQLFQELLRRVLVAGT